MTSYTITKYQYYEYSLDDYNKIKSTFYEIFGDFDENAALNLINALGIIKLLGDSFKRTVVNETSVLIGEENHKYIIRFVDREIDDLKDEIKKGFNSYWHDEYRYWIKSLSEIRQRLINKAPVINK